MIKGKTMLRTINPASAIIFNSDNYENSYC